MIDEPDYRCPKLEPGETLIAVIRPQTFGGKSRPRGTLLQSAVVIKARLYRVGRSLRSVDASSRGGKSVTLPFLSLVAYLARAGDSCRWAA